MVLVTGSNCLFSYFIIAAVIESYKKVSLDLENQKYLAMAKKLYEYGLRFNRDEIYKDTRFIIQAQIEKADEDL
jgi:hypothetical protein